MQKKHFLGIITVLIYVLLDCHSDCPFGPCAREAGQTSSDMIIVIVRGYPPLIRWDNKHIG